MLAAVYLVLDIASSNLFIEFTDHWLDADGSTFKEPIFFDGMFGRFSSYGILSYPDNEEESYPKNLLWNDEEIEITFYEKNKSFEDLKGKIFIDCKLEKEFKSNLIKIIDIFN